MEGSQSETLEEHQKVESLAEDKEVVVEAAVTDVGDIAIKEEQKTESEENKVEDTEDVPESVAVELELKEEEREDVESPEDSDAKEAAALDPSENEGSRETETVEIIKDVRVTEEEEENVIVVSSVVTDEEPTDVASKETTLETGVPKSDEEPTDVALKETLETSVPKPDEEATDVASNETLETGIPKSDEVPPIITEVAKGIEESLVPSTEDKVAEQPHGQDESIQPSAVIPEAESASAAVKDSTEVPRSTDNQIVGPATQRQHTCWNSCCGLFEFLRGGDR